MDLRALLSEALQESGYTWSDFGGIRPRAWVCAGSGFSREDVKALLLSRDIAFTADAVQTFTSLSQRVAGIDPAKVLQSPGRQEVLRLILSDPGLKERFPELKRLKRQGAFLRRLDTAVQAGRQAFAHWEEAEVFSERLGRGSGSLRQEIEILARGYEHWLEQSGHWDPPSVTRGAVERSNAAARLSFLPEVVFHLSAQTQESLERSFWEALSRDVRVIRLGPALAGAGSAGAGSEATAEAPRLEGSPNQAQWNRWHTLDDAAESLAQELAGSDGSASDRIRDSVVLIADVASSRRSLRRALEQHGIALSDPRDPTRIRWDEAVKWALLPLETAARGFERQSTIALIRSYLAKHPAFEGKLPEIIREIHDRGIRSGLGSYSGGKLAQVHRELSAIAERFSGKRTVGELALAHLGFLRDAAGTGTGAPGRDLSWVHGFFEQLWIQFFEDLDRVGLGTRRAAALYWLERLQARLSESRPPVERLKPRGGLDVYRVHQAPPRAYKRVYVFGIPPLWFSPGGAGMGDYWFSERDRELLASEFAVRSAAQVRGERIAALSAWLRGAETAVFLDASYDPDGRERESILPVLEELARVAAIAAPQEDPTECGSHPRWQSSYGALRPVPPQSARLPRLADSAPVISASALENYSRCGFLALARQRWRIEDLPEPDMDLWPQVKGILLHEAVRLLVESREEEGGFAKSIEEAIELAWRSKRPRGLLRGARVEAYVKRKMAVLLRIFAEQERKYARRSGTRVVGLEDVEFRVDYPGFTVVGEPDRIDEHPDGLWIIDYKTSSQAPNGMTMLENGYRLQLPFYALAARRKFGKPVLGFQFVQLDRKGNRTNGAYFKAHNGKEPGKLTDTTARSKSLLNLPPEEVWSRFEAEIAEQGARYVAGEFTAMPRLTPRSKECSSCSVADFCGYRRLLEEESAE